MKSFLQNSLNVRASELNAVLLMLILGFFMGIFVATYSVSSTALFLLEFQAMEQEALPVAFILSGIVGVVATYLYSYFQKRIHYELMVAVFTILMVLTVIALRLDYEFNIPIGFVDGKDANALIGFIFIGPFVTILLLIFWGIFNRIFDVNQSKRIIGSIDTGQLVAALITLVAIPLLVEVYKLIEVRNLLIISTLSIGLYLIVVLIILRRYHIEDTKEAQQEMLKHSKSFREMFKNRYILLMSIFVIVSMIGVVFIDYIYLNATSESFGEDEGGLTTFLSVFEAAIVVLSFVFQTFFTDRMIENYGLKVSLLVTPIILGAFALLSGLAGLSLFGGYESGSANFLLFFIAIALSKLFTASLKDALDGPTFKLYFMPLNKSERFDVQAKVEGVIMVFAGLVAGSLLLLIDKIKFLNYLHVVFLILPIVAIWIFTTIKMHGRYREALINILKGLQGKGRNLISKLFDGDENTNKYLTLKNARSIIHSISVLEKVDPVLYETVLDRYRKNKNPEVKEFISGKNSIYQVDDSSIASDSNDASEIKKLALEALKSSEKKDRLLVTKEQMGVLSRSKNVTDRIFAANVVAGLMNDDNIFILLELLRDHDSKVKKVAIHAASLAQREETWPILIELLSSPIHGQQACLAIVKMGEKILPTLELFFHKSGQDHDRLVMIIQIYGMIKSKLSVNYLFKKLDYPDNAIRVQTLNSLKQQKFELKGFRTTIINTILDSELSKILWNMTAISEVAKEDHTELLRDALEQEIEANFERMYALLSMLYNPDAIRLVEENMKTGTSEGITYAIELLNVFVADELKPKLFPLLEDLPAQEKVKRLLEHFPRENYDPLAILHQIIFRDIGLLNRWTKACAIYSLSKTEGTDITNGLIGQLFNQDKLLRNTASWFIRKKNKNLHTEIFKRIEDNPNYDTDDLLIEVQSERTDENEIPAEIQYILFLKEQPLFKGISSVILSEILDHLKVRKYATGVEVCTKGEYADELFMVFDGQLILTEPGKDSQYINQAGLIGGIITTGENHNNLEAFANEYSKVLHLPMHELYKLMATYREVKDSITMNSMDINQHETQEM